MSVGTKLRIRFDNPLRQIFDLGTKSTHTTAQSKYLAELANTDELGLQRITPYGI